MISTQFLSSNIFKDFLRVSKFKLLSQIQISYAQTAPFSQTARNTSSNKFKHSAKTRTSGSNNSVSKKYVQIVFQTSQQQLQTILALRTELKYCPTRRQQLNCFTTSSRTVYETYDFAPVHQHLEATCCTASTTLYLANIIMCKVCRESVRACHEYWILDADFMWKRIVDL